MAEILKAGTTPLPFVQRGMKIGVVGRQYDALRPETYGCVIMDVAETDGVTVVVLRGEGTGRSAIARCEQVQRCYVLLADFDPDLARGD